MSPKAPDPIPESAEHILPSGLSPPEVGGHVPRLHRQHYGVGLKAVQRALRIQDLLGVGVELAQVNLQRDSRGIRAGPQKGHDRFHRKRAQDGPALLRQAEAAGDAVIPRGYEPGQGRSGLQFPRRRQHSRRRGRVARVDGAVDVLSKFPSHHLRLCQVVPLPAPDIERATLL